MLTRKESKAQTRANIEKTAREMFETLPYEQASVRRIATAAGLSIGAVFANFKNKADLWRAVMGTAPPVDRPTVRQADALETALRELVAACRAGDPSPALENAEAVLAQLDQSPA